MKVHDEPMPLERLIHEAFRDLLRNDEESTLTKSKMYQNLEYDIVANENVMLKTLGFQLTIDQPEGHITRCCEMLKVNSETLQWAQVIAANSLHLTTMCLQYSPHIIGTFAVYFVCKWSKLEIPMSTEGQPWYAYMDEAITEDMLNKMIRNIILKICEF
ncbi:hypothetical protein PV328_004245 [Microctonus aethiopoides]|uniref:Uncharacterized protein n=1 Tax=Microctonus aethiopoides TaxID=144406 RepID=A0AA39FA58_9HYME|nr:hypothetical protein PV328_004245 [Microctonus aethiopoides]